MSLEAQMDDLLVNMTSQIGKGCPGLLDQLFGFLYRRTDFFVEMEPTDKMGFPPGVASQMVFQHFKKYQDMHFKKFPPKEGCIKRWEEYNKNQRELAQAKAQAQANTEAKKESTPSKVEEIGENLHPDIEEKKEFTSEQKAKIMNEHIQKQNKERMAAENPKPQISSQPKVQIPKEMEDISTYNGASTEKYKWSQDITEVIVQIDLPEGTSAKSLTVDMKMKNLKVINNSNGDEYVNGELFEKIDTEDSYWSVEDKKRLILTLAKAQEVIWKTIIVGDDEIDAKKVDNSKRLDQFDEETQGHLQKVLYEQNRKLNGLPTTEEMEQQKLMEKVMKADNSPFQESPYDPPKYGQGPQIPFKN